VIRDSPLACCQNFGTACKHPKEGMTMRNFVTVVFDDTQKAYKGLHALWQLDEAGDITVHRTAVVHRDEWGHFRVDTKETHAVYATAVGVGIGALLGMLAGPAGVAIGAAGGAAIGATAGAVIGSAISMGRSQALDDVGFKAGFVLDRSHSEVIADITEDWPWDINARMRSLQGTVFRRSLAVSGLIPR
jgi:uncharacterized membrane protein